jgi:hypothetical protein
MLEGGGQILRNATALAAITGRAVVVSRIRAGAPLRLERCQSIPLLARARGRRQLAACCAIHGKPTYAPSNFLPQAQAARTPACPRST